MTESSKKSSGGAGIRHERSVPMSKTIHAVFENGVFRPVDPVDLPDRCEVEFEVREVKPDSRRPSLDEVYAILGKRFDSGEPDVAARHDEHQP
jgi:predicted DNA-binding antitoxin AbrB/MazE fold protein